MIRYTFILSISVMLLLQSQSTTAYRTGEMGHAVSLIEQGQCNASLRIIGKSGRPIPYVRDYVLYHRAQAQFACNKRTRALKTIKELLRKYPGSPVRQLARRLELDIHLSGDWDKAFPSVESYIREYPNDNETRFLYAERLKKRGRRKLSQKIYRELYISAGDYSDQSYELLDNTNLTHNEKFKLASNQYKKHWYFKAEPILLGLLKDDKCPLREKERHMYAYTLFRQKKYKEAIPHLIILGERYNAARAYIRSGDRESFHRTVLTMVANKDKDAPRLFVALAEEARRSGEPDKALEYLENTIKLFPEEKENALWSKGWLFYRIGMMDNAENIFNSLYKEYANEKYSYWAARAKEHTAGNANFSDISGDGYYALLSMLRSGDYNGRTYKEEDFSSRRYHRLRRADILLAEGLNEDAAVELRSLARKTRRYKELLEIGRRLVQAGQYDIAQRLMIRVPDSKRPDEILFPHAYWPIVSEVADQYAMDPYLMLSLMREESLFDSEAFSPAGAIGLMQLMPSTAKRTARAAGIDLKDKGELFLADMNIRIGTHYFSNLLRDFGSVTPGIAAYNAGERVVRKWLKEGGYDSYDEFVEDIPYKETREYVKRIMRSYYRYHIRQNKFPSLPEQPGIL